MKAIFDVHGPIRVPFDLMKNGTKWIKMRWPKKWERDRQILAHASKRGCYVFAVRSGGGIKPYYVGKTKASFRQEAFTSGKINYYNEAMAGYAAGRPVMFFVTLRQKPGPVNHKAIRNLEKFLIQTAVAKNPDLKNVQGTKEQDWVIEGVLRSRPGMPARPARSFKTMMGI
jgi:hypothetical protein